MTRHKANNKHGTGWAKGAPSEDHTTPHRPPGPLAAASLLGGNPQAPAVSGVANPPGPILWSGPILGADVCPCYPPPYVRLTCARISSRRAAVSAPAFAGLKAWPVGAHAAPTVLGISRVWLNALSRPLFSSTSSSVWPGVAPPALALPSSSVNTAVSIKTVECSRETDESINE
jgi:hypothetical protein